jgi:hypothetical protein
MTRNGRRRFVATLICAAALLPGCTGGRAEVTPGEVLQVREEFDFFFRGHGDQYFIPPLPQVQNLLEERSWQVPDGTTLERPQVNVTTTKVRWRDGRMEYEAAGFRVTVACTLTVAEDAQPGERVLAVTFPDLVEAAKVQGFSPSRTYHDALLSSPANALEVKRINIHASAGEKYHARYAPFGWAMLVVGSILAVVVGLVSVWIILDRGPAGNRGFFCEHCGVEAPTKYVAFYQNIGAIVIRFTDQRRGYLCKSCIHRFFWRCSGITLFLGWWGAASMIMTPFILIQNLLRYLLCLRLPAVPLGAEKAALNVGVVERLGPHLKELVRQVNEDRPFPEVAEDIAAKAGVTPAQVALYVEARLAAKKSKAR